MTQQTKTLEYIAKQLLERVSAQEKKGEKESEQEFANRVSKKISRSIYQASFLATLEATYRTIGTSTSPTPLYRISYDPQTNTLDFSFLGGKGKPPVNSIDVEVSDLIITSLQSDRIPLLNEGITGTGKTHTLEKVIQAVYDTENRKVLRLNANMSNVLQPYINGRIDNGVLRVNINYDAARQIAVLVIDEQNRGDTNAILGLLDNQVTLATGERAELGLLIPELSFKNGGLQVYFNDRTKPVAVHSAQNPSGGDYTGARSTDSAVGNRQVLITYPNMALHSGAATLNMVTTPTNMHENFMRHYIGKLASYLQLDSKQLAQLLLPQANSEEEKERANQEYLTLHAFSFDPRHSRNMFLKSAVEGADHIMLLTGGEGLAKNFQEDIEDAKSWTQILSRYKVNFNYAANIDPNSNAMKRIDGVRSSFKYPLIERDKAKATRLADMLSLITRYKKAYANSRERGSSPHAEFDALQQPLTLQDIACAYSIVLNDKVQSKNGVSPIDLINNAFKDYVNLWKSFSTEIYKKKGTFDLNDPNASVRYVASYLAVKSIAGADKGAPDQYAATMIKEVNKVAEVLRGLDDGNDTTKLLIARINADLAAFAGFIHEYRGFIANEFNKVPKSNEVLPRYEALKRLVEFARGDVKTHYTLPRVERIFGI